MQFFLFFSEEKTYTNNFSGTFKMRLLSNSSHDISMSYLFTEELLIHNSSKYISKIICVE